MQTAADQSFDRGRYRTGCIGEAAERIAVQAAGESDRQADQRPAQNAAQDGANGAGIGDGAFNLEAEIGAHDAESGKYQVTDEFVRQTDGHLHQRGE